MVAVWPARLAGGLFLLIPTIMQVFGISQILGQHHKITTYEPVPARVVASRIETKRGNKSTTYRPVVHFEYEVNGQSFHDYEVTPIRYSSSGNWACETVARYPAGLTTTAYYDPADPSNAFLERRYLIVPYLFALFPLIFQSVGLGILMGSAASPGEPIREADGWYRLKPTSRIADRLRMSGVLTSLWGLIGGGILGHFFWNAARPYETMALVVGGVFVAGAIGVIGGWIYYKRLLANIGDALLNVDTGAIQLGQPFQVRFTQPLRANIEIESATLAVVCTVTTRERRGGKTRTSSREYYREETPMIGADYRRAGETVSAAGQFIIPAHEPASSRASADYPRYEWTLRLHTKLAGSPDYRATFPVVVV